MQYQKPSSSSTLVFCAAAPSDAARLSQWETHLLPLEQAGYLTIWSEQHLLAGSPRREQMLDHLEQADLLVLLLSADFFASDECITLMEQALRRHQDGEARLIPLLLRPIMWRESPLASLSCIPSNQLPVTEWTNLDTAFDECVREILLILAPSQIHQQRPRLTLQNQNRVRMLRRLRRSYSDLVSQSLQGSAWLELGLTEKPDAVQNATNLLLRVSNRAEEVLPPGTSITQVYDEAEHELLILGEPGAGKSTLLLDLAQQLVARAEKDEIHPLPMILPLSSWATKRGSLEDWMAEQLVQIYDVPRKLSVQWVREGNVLPLLDGLDEMEEKTRPACIAIINAYHRDHITPLVVCSRTTEYEAATSHHRLALQAAVVVQPLTHEDVDTCLVRAGQPLTALRSALKKNAALHDLATTPLMLNILTLTYQGTSVRGLSNKEPLLLQQVWDDYVRRMVERKGNNKHYPLERTRMFLGWLAREMRDHNQTVFYLEHLQPNWLAASQQRTYTWRAIRLPAIVIGVLLSFLIQSFFFSPTDRSSYDPSYIPYAGAPDVLLLLLQYGMLGGLLGGLWYGSQSRKGSQGDVWGKRLVVSSCIGLMYGLGIALTHVLRFGFDYDPSYYFLGEWPIQCLSYGVGIGLGSLLLQHLLMRPNSPNVSSGNSTVRGWKGIVRLGSAVQGPRALLVTAVTGLSVGLSVGLGYGLIYLRESGWNFTGGIIYGPEGPSNGLSIGLGYGVSYGLISLILGTHMENIHLTERIRWTWRGLFNPGHLRNTILLSCVSTIFFTMSVGLSDGLSDALGYGVSNGLSEGIRHGLSVGLSDGLSFPGGGLNYGLAIGLSFWCMLGLYQSIGQERIEDRDRRVTNQGIHRSLRNGIIMGIIVGAMIGAIGILNLELTYYSSSLSETLQDLIRMQSNVINCGLTLGMSGAVLIYILTGGLAIWRHYMLRLILQHARVFPWKAPQFLDDATARFLLRHVGGGYSFTHRLLLDYFASLETPSSEKVTTASATRGTSLVTSKASQIGTTDREAPPALTPSRKTGSNKANRVPTLFIVMIILLALITSTSIFGIIHDQRTLDASYQATAQVEQPTYQAYQATARVDQATYQAYDNTTATAQAEANATAKALANASPIAYPPTNMSPVLNDPLQDNSKGNKWEIDDPTRGDCKFINRAYDINTDPNQSEWCIAGATNFTNFIYEIQMKIVQGNEGGIAFRIDPKREHDYEFAINRDGSYSVSEGYFGSVLAHGPSSPTGYATRL